ncbi:glutathione S-transferase [Sphingomonas naasensis]|uniref:glutathione transferase n=1 Tax=Sphingomonas naasensis TaxID=1344951 RepID=A0A4S1WGQ5_9SPHN|nr:glutathione S-transferase family protein [Sphingomonas naasensis]NIJ22040.1 glutathione S-transferase [Sphingomonas naasensis]TGX42284.1 glutathione S-transferase family protein [Sphingomonas naasensis]
MIVFGSTLSPYVRKCMVFGAEKGLALELQPAGMGRGGPDFQAASPFGKMPGFKDEDFLISDSSAIVAYIEAKYPDPNLIPAEPRARARTIWYDELADTIMMAAGGAIFGNRFVLPRVLKQDCDHEAADRAERDQLPPIFDYLENMIPASGFLVEDRLTLADIAVASPFATLGCIEVRANPARHPRTAAYLEAIHARPSFAEIIARDQATVAAMGGPVSAQQAA